MIESALVSASRRSAWMCSSSAAADACRRHADAPRFAPTIGVMISASHNQYQTMASSCSVRRAEAFGRARARNRSADGERPGGGSCRPARNRAGQAHRNAQARYIEFVKRTFPNHLRLEGLPSCRLPHGLPIAGARRAVELGAMCSALASSPTGININQEVGSTAPGAMIEKVKETRADFASRWTATLTGS